MFGTLDAAHNIKVMCVYLHCLNNFYVCVCECHDKKFKL